MGPIAVRGGNAGIAAEAQPPGAEAQTFLSILRPRRKPFLPWITKLLKEGSVAYPTFRFVRIY